MKKVRFLGLDVHADTIAVAVAEPDGEVRSLGIIPNREESVRKLVKKLGPAGQLQAHARAAEIFGPGLIADDIIATLPQVWRELCGASA